MMMILSQSLKAFSKGLHSMAWYWVAWVYFMILVNGILPLFFLPRFTAILVLVSGMTGIAVALVLTHAFGYKKILGLMHFPWIPMVCFQIYYLYLQNFSLIDLHSYWLLLSLTVSTLSLIIDFKDVHEFLNSN